MLTSELAYKNASSLHHSSYRLTVCSFDSVIFKMYERCANKITYKSGGIQFSFGLCGSASNIGSIYKQLKEKINILSSWKMTESSRPFWYAKKVNQSYSPQPCRHFWIWAISTHIHTHTHAYRSQLGLHNTMITINFTEIEIKSLQQVQVFLHTQLLWLWP